MGFIILMLRRRRLYVKADHFPVNMRNPCTIPHSAWMKNISILNAVNGHNRELALESEGDLKAGVRRLDGLPCNI